MNDQAYESFFNDIYNEYHRAIYSYLLTRVDNKEIAKDLLQEVFLRAWNQIHVGNGMEWDETIPLLVIKITKN